jgi:LacI family transcriptional regulator
LAIFEPDIRLIIVHHVLDITIAFVNVCPVKKNCENAKSLTAIAEECGVSTMTVSRALRSNSPVKEETRTRIVAAAERLGYIRSPRMGRPAAPVNSARLRIQLIAGTVGLRLPIFDSRLLITIEQHLAERGHECVIRTCNGDYSQFLQLLENIRHSDADATMLLGCLVPEQLRALLDALPEAVLLDNPGDPSVETPYGSFAFDNVEAARIAVRHLLDCGRRRILLAGGVRGHFFTKEIEQGYRETLVCRGIAADEKLFLYTDFTADGAYRAVSAALKDGVQFDAVFTNDEMASGVYRALLERGFTIPGDVSVCGCDGLPVGTHLFPRLTTVLLDYEELASMAIRHILEKNKESRTHYHVRILPVLEVRESTACSKNGK